MICFWVSKQLIRHSEGKLDGISGWLVCSHLHSCGRCASELEDLKQMAMVYRRSAEPPPEPRESVWGSLESVLLAETGSSRVRKGARWLRPAALAGAVASLVLGAFWLNMRPGDVPENLVQGNETFRQGILSVESPDKPVGVVTAAPETSPDSASADRQPYATAPPQTPRSRVRLAGTSGPRVGDKAIQAEKMRVAAAESPVEVASALDEPLPEMVNSLDYGAPATLGIASEPFPVGRMADTAKDDHVSPVPPFMGEGPPSVLLETTTVAEMHHPGGLAMLGGSTGDYPELDARSIEMIYSSPEERAKTIFNY